MCGIVAVVDPRRELTEGVLSAMRDQLAHRGPDGAENLIVAGPEGSVGLGHRRLAIIDLTDAAGQPMLSADGTLALIHNGEIYNYVELREELAAAGHRFRTRSDTEVLLTAYEHWGTDCLARLNGMFAFVIWDARRGEVFVARDRFGEKPLFMVTLPGGGRAFASELKALLAHPDVEASLDEETLESYVAGRYFEEGESTFFRGIERVPAAHALVVETSGRIRGRWRYWTPEYAARDDYDEERAVDELRELLLRSVRMRLRSDVPVGTSLSGGLDSSIIVGLLAGIRNESATFTQNTFSARFDDDPTLSEGEYVDLVAERAGVNPYFVSPDPHALAEESLRLHWHQEEPFLSASIYLQWCVMRLASSAHTTVLLDGQGADELLAGYQYYFRDYQLDRLDRRELVRLVRETRAFSGRLRRAQERYESGARRFDANVALSARGLAVAAARRPAVMAGAYDVGVPAAVRGGRLRRRIAEALQYNSLPLLLRYADRNGMAFSRETRFPFLDHDLVDWCVSLPDRAFVSDGWQKHILRRAAEGLVPPEVQWRADKVGYAAPLDAWLRGPLKDWARERLFDGAIRDVTGYDATELETLWREHQHGANHSWGLWRWISLSEWFTLLDWGRRHGWRAGAAAGERLAVAVAP